MTNSWTILRSQNKWGAKFSGASSYGLQITNANGVTLDGIAITNATGNGLMVWGGTNHTLKNLWLSGSGDHGIEATNVLDMTLEMSLLENNGNTANTDCGASLAGTNIVLRGNVARGNYWLGLRLYSPTSKPLSGSRTYNNLVYSNAVGGSTAQVGGVGIYPQSSAMTNWLYGNTVVSPNQPFAVQVEASMQLFSKVGFSRSRASSSGKRSSASTVLPIRLVVVSWPAFSRKMQFWTSSSWLSRSPSTVPWISVPRMSPSTG